MPPESRKQRARAVRRIFIKPPMSATPTQVEAMVGRDRDARFGRLDVVINNAGGAPPADPSTVSPRFSESIIKLNLLAPLVSSRRPPI